MGSRMSVRLLVVIFLPVLLLALPSAAYPEPLNKDGLAVVRLSDDDYRRIVKDARVITDRNLTTYISAVAARLVPDGTELAPGVSVSVTVLDRDLPEVYSMANGTIVITSGAVTALENEAQMAAVLAHEVAHIVDAHYPSIYQAFKEVEAKRRRSMLAAGLAGVVVGAAIDYTVASKTNEIYADLDAGDISYREAMKKITTMEIGAGTLEGFSDVYQSLPPETRAGSGDPRVPLEMVADAGSLTLMARSGYDPGQAGEAWRRLRKKSDRAKETDMGSLAMTFLPAQMRTLISGVEDPAGNIRAEALTRTVNHNPPDRPDFLDSLARSREITALKRGPMTVGRADFARVIGGFVMGGAREAFEEGDYGRSKELYQAAWDSGYRTADVAYHLGRSQFGEFAFAASEREKETAENYLLKAIELDPGMPEPYKALGELYGEWDMYQDSARMYRKYLRAAPGAPDRNRVERQIEKMERKSRR